MMKPAHTHVKMRRLSAMLRPLFISSPVDPQTVATGLLERLWYYTAENHKSGFLQNVDAVLLSIEIGWYGDAEFLLDALINCGWIDKKDGVLSVHDWLHHCPQWVHGSLARSLQAKEAQDLKDKLKDDLESNLKKDLKVAHKGETFPEPCSLFPEPITLNPRSPPQAAHAKAGRKKKEVDPMVEPPDRIDRETWKEFYEMRIKHRCGPMTTRAQNLMIKKLMTFRDPKASLENAIIGNYSDCKEWASYNQQPRQFDTGRKTDDYGTGSGEF